MRRMQMAGLLAAVLAAGGGGDYVAPAPGKSPKRTTPAAPAPEPQPDRPLTRQQRRAMERAEAKRRRTGDRP